MAREERALAVRARVDASEDPRDRAAEAALRAALDDVARLDAEVEALSGALADFARRYERRLAAPFEDLAAAERLVRRLQGLEEALQALVARLRAGGSAPARGRPADAEGAAGTSPGPRATPGEDGPGAGGGAEGVADDALEETAEVLPEELSLKRLYRRLARLLHPDLAGVCGDPDGGARRGELMRRLNAAYAQGDLTALELMAEKLGAGEPLGDLSPEERRAHLDRRAATLSRVAASLARERDRLLGSDTARVREEALRHEAAGRDHLAETAAEAGEEAEAAYADALARLGRVFEVASEITRARSVGMGKIERRGPTGARRAFDPLEESEIVRMGAARLERQRATPEARELARVLEGRATDAPHEVALVLLAFFAEAAAGRPPPTLATAEGWSRCWERLRAVFPAAPALPRMLARPPRHLVLGARSQGEEVVAGVQLADAALLAGVRIALERASVGAVGRDVLRVLGPEERCAGCGRAGPALHLLRTRGLDELHGLACPACGAVLRSYWRYGEAEGLEALAPYALRLGLVAEATAQLAGTALGFQMRPCEREALTAGELRRRMIELYLVPYGVELREGALGVARGAAPLGEATRIGGAGRLRFTVAGEAGPEALLELLRARIERRFRA